MTSLAYSALSNIICRMGHPAPKLAVHHLAFGLERLLTALTNEGCQAWCRKAGQRVQAFLARVPEPEAVFGYNVFDIQFKDDIVYELFGTCTNSPTLGYTWETSMRWSYAEFETRQDGSIRSLSGRFRFDVQVVLPAVTCPPSEVQHTAVPLPRKACQLLDSFASHCVFVPPRPQLSGLVCLEWLAQLVIRAAKSGHLREDAGGAKLQDQACQVFRQLAEQSTLRSLNKLPREERTEASDAVFRRFVMSKFGRGFLAPSSLNAFRSYVRKAICGAAQDIRFKQQRHRSGGSGKFHNGKQLLDDSQDFDTDRLLLDAAIPRGIVEAAERLSVSPSTIWRRMQAHGYATLTPQAWEQIKADIKGKASWRAIEKLLVARGISLPAARKRICRWKNAGKDSSDIAHGLLMERETL